MAYRPKAFIPIKRNLGKSDSYLKRRVPIRFHNVQEELPDVSEQSLEYHRWRLWQKELAKQQNNISTIYDTTPTYYNQTTVVLIYWVTDNYESSITTCRRL